jgi:protein TonB
MLVWSKLSHMQIAVLVSVTLHGALLTVRFVDPEGFNRVFKDTPLEVVLVNSRAEQRPDKALALAQANLSGGGQADQGRATSPLPPSAKIELGDESERQRAQISKLQEQQQQLLATIRRELALLPTPDPARESNSPKARDQEERRRQLLQLLAEIEKRVNTENTRPRKKYVSPSTQEVIYAQYYDSLRRRVEARGTRDFPEYMGKKLYGELTMNIHVDLRGKVVETDVVASSGNRQLDRRAEAIVRAASPFGQFTPAMLKDAELLVITSRFRFTREDGLETSLSN